MEKMSTSEKEGEKFWAMQIVEVDAEKRLQAFLKAT